MVLIEYGASAFEISGDIATEANEVHITTRSLGVKVGNLENYKNIWQRMMVCYLVKLSSHLNITKVYFLRTESRFLIYCGKIE